jgi:hypothetical protein
MFHSGAQHLIDLWSHLPRAGRFPEQSAFDPVELGRALPHAFIAEMTEAGAAFRLAGSWIETLHGRPLKGVRWLDLWAKESRLLIHRTTTQALIEARPMVIMAMAGPDQAPVEVVMAPIRGPSGQADRLLGLYQPTTEGAKTLKDVGPLSARLAVPVVAQPGRPLPTLAVVDGRRVAGA